MKSWIFHINFFHQASKSVLNEKTLEEIEKVYSACNDFHDLLKNLYRKETKKFGGVQPWHNQWN